MIITSNYMKKLVIIFSILSALATSYYIYRIISKPQSPFKKYAQSIPGTYRIGFTNLDQELSNQPLTIQGTIPTWLNGTLLRNGPAQFYTDSSWVTNWFDGLAMIHAFTLHNGTVTYSNKFLKTTDYVYVQKTGTMNYAGFMQDPCGSLFKNLFSLFIHDELAGMPAIPNANVSFTSYADRLAALTEIPLPVEFDPQTLETLGVIEYADQLPKKNIHDTPHPHYDPVAHEHIGYFTHFGNPSTVNLYSIADGQTSRRIIASYEAAEPSYMHSFAITQQYAILTALPLVVSPTDLLYGNAFIKSFRWKPELGTKLIVINRHTGAIQGSYQAPPFFAFHTVNAYEQDSTIILDVITYPDASSLDQALFATLLEPTHHDTATSSKLHRYTINLTNTTVTDTILTHATIELPRINYAFNGKPYTYLYAEEYKQTRHYVADGLIKINVNTGATVQWHADNCFPGEPVFIAHPTSSHEDDGVVLSVVLDVARGNSFLLVLDAHTFTEIARSYAPHHIPFGIHGSYFPQKF